MSNKNITDLTEKTTISESDVVVVEDSNGTYKSTKANLLKEIKTSKFDDVTISGSNLSFYANGTSKKTITLPTSSSGSGTTLPSQTGNAGKVLGTDGTNLSWVKQTSGGSGGTSIEFNVKDYGAHGDFKIPTSYNKTAYEEGKINTRTDIYSGTVHDDSLAFYDAVQAANLVGGTVVFPPGTYYLNPTTLRSANKSIKAKCNIDFGSANIYIAEQGAYHDPLIEMVPDETKYLFQRGSQVGDITASTFVEQWNDFSQTAVACLDKYKDGTLIIWSGDALCQRTQGTVVTQYKREVGTIGTSGVISPKRLYKYTVDGLTNRNCTIWVTYSNGYRFVRGGNIILSGEQSQVTDKQSHLPFIKCTRSYVHFQDIFVQTNIERKIGDSPSYGIIYLRDCSNILVDNCRFFIRENEVELLDPYKTPGQNYILRYDQVSNVTYRNVVVDGSGSWHSTVGYYGNKITYENCLVDAIDTHCGVDDLLARDCTIRGEHCVAISGTGNHVFENCHFHLHQYSKTNPYIVDIKQDLAYQMGGSVKLKGCTINLYGGSSGNEMVKALIRIQYLSGLVSDYDIATAPNILVDDLTVFTDYKGNTTVRLLDISANLSSNKIILPAEATFRDCKSYYRDTTNSRIVEAFPLFRYEAPGQATSQKIYPMGTAMTNRSEMKVILDNVWLAGYDRANNYRGIGWTVDPSMPYKVILDVMNVPCPIGLVSWGGGFIRFTNCVLGTLALYGTSGTTKHFIEANNCRIATYSNSTTVSPLFYWNSVTDTDARIYLNDCIITPPSISSGLVTSSTDFIKANLGIINGSNARVNINNLKLDYAYFDFSKTIPTFTNKTY